jgi:hypothetical protein
MLMQILVPVSKRPEGVNILTSGGLNAVRQPGRERNKGVLAHGSRTGTR